MSEAVRHVSRWAIVTLTLTALSVALGWSCGSPQLPTSNVSFEQVAYNLAIQKFYSSRKVWPRQMGEIRSYISDKMVRSRSSTARLELQHEEVEIAQARFRIVYPDHSFPVLVRIRR